MLAGWQRYILKNNILLVLVVAYLVVKAVDHISQSTDRCGKPYYHAGPCHSKLSDTINNATSRLVSTN